MLFAPSWTKENSKKENSRIQGFKSSTRALDLDADVVLLDCAHDDSRDLLCDADEAGLMNGRPERPSRLHYSGVTLRTKTRVAVLHGRLINANQTPLAESDGLDGMQW